MDIETGHKFKDQVGILCRRLISALYISTWGICPSTLQHLKLIVLKWRQIWEKITT